MSAVLEKPTWALVGVFPLTNDQMALDRLKVVLDESDEEYFKELTQYYRSIRQPEFTPEKHREALQYLELHPIRSMLLRHLTHWVSQNQSLRMIIDKDKLIQWSKINNWPNLENNSGAVCTGTALPSATQVLTDISEIKQKLADCHAVGVIKPYPLDEQEQIVASAPPMKHTLLSEKQRHTLLTRVINEINRFYYEQIDRGLFSGETTFLIKCEQTKAVSELAILGERVCEYFNNIFDPEYPRKKFHISTVINDLTDGGLGVVLKWGLHADRANDAEKSTTRSIQHIDIEQVVLP